MGAMRRRSGISRYVYDIVSGVTRIGGCRLEMEILLCTDLGSFPDPELVKWLLVLLAESSSMRSSIQF